MHFMQNQKRKIVITQGTKREEGRSARDTSKRMEDKLADAFGDDDREAILREEAEMQEKDAEIDLLRSKLAQRMQRSIC